MPTNIQDNILTQRYLPFRVQNGEVFWEVELHLYANNFKSELIIVRLGAC